MLKIVYRICCGMDVHKSFVVACIASTNEQGVTSYKTMYANSEDFQVLAITTMVKLICGRME